MKNLRKMSMPAFISIPWKKNISYPVTQGWYSATQPAFSPDGRYLYFVSGRNFNPVFSWTEWNHAFLDMESIYLVTLSPEIESPFRPLRDEVAIKTKPAPSEKKEEETVEPKENLKNKIDPEGIQDRIIALPIKASAYWNLTATENALYYQRQDSQAHDSRFIMYDLSERQEFELGTVDGYVISADLKKMLVQQGESYAIIDLPKAAIELKNCLDLTRMEILVNKKQEWQQIFHECWRQMREFFYAPNMHGVDWPKVSRQYEPLLEYVTIELI